jgi:hypothetical protein
MTTPALRATPPVSGGECASPGANQLCIRLVYWFNDYLTREAIDDNA